MTTGGRGAGHLEAIVLAAGAGTRFGGGKLVAPWRGRPLIEGALAAALAAPARGVAVVVGADPRVAAILGARAGVRLVHASDHAEGMAASLRTGIAALAADTAGAFVFLGDMPLIPHAILSPLADALRQGARVAAPVFRGRRGHPVLFGRELFADLLRLVGDEGARSVLDRFPGGPTLVESGDEGVLFDVDLRGRDC